MQMRVLMWKTQQVHEKLQLRLLSHGLPAESKPPSTGGRFTALERGSQCLHHSYKDRLTLPKRGRRRQLRLGTKLTHFLKAQDLLITPSLLCLCSANGQQTLPTACLRGSLALCSKLTPGTNYVEERVSFKIVQGA